MAEKRKMTDEEKRLKKKERELRNQAKIINRQIRATNKEQKHIYSNREAQAEFMDFIVEQYGLIFIPSTLSRKLVAINEGTYTGLTRGIPWEDLLRMFDYSKKKIKEARVYKKKQGEMLNPIAQFNYDLAIVLNGAAEYYQSLEQAKEKLATSLDKVNWNIEKAVAGQEIARKKQRLAELEKQKNERDEVDLSELFSDF